MATKKLTDKTVRSLKTNKRSEFFWDSSFKVHGGSFGVRVFDSGIKKYYINYRNEHGQQRRIVIADAAKIGLAQARKMATAELLKVDQGVDPAQERTMQKKAETVSDLCDLYLEYHAKPNKKPAGYRADQLKIKKDILPKIGHMKVNLVQRRDIIAILDEIQFKRKAVVTAERTRALLHKIFSFAIQRDIIQTSPCVGLPKVSKTKARERFLSDHEIKKFLKACEQEDWRNQYIFKILLFTGKRASEVMGMRWSELDKSLTALEIPANRAKNNKAHKVPLSQLATNALRKVRNHHKQENIDSPLVFPSTSSNDSVKWLTKATKRIYTNAKIDKFTPHDLRRTFTTQLASLGASERTLKKLLNHSASNSITELHYNFHDEFVEMKRALKAYNLKLKKYNYA